MKSIECIVLMALFASGALGQSLSIGVGSGIDVVQGENFYTKDLGPDGIWFVNGAWGFFHGLKFANKPEFDVAAKYSFKLFDLTTQIHLIPMRGGRVVEIPVFDGHQTIVRYPSVRTKLDIWSVQVGARYCVEVGRLKLFLAMAGLVNYFGALRLQFDYGDLMTHVTNYNNGLRYGYRVGPGVVYRISSKLDIELGGGFNSMNPANGRHGEERLNTIDAGLSAYYTIFEQCEAARNNWQPDAD